MLQGLFAPSPAKAAGRRLYDAAAAKARDPAFYLDAGAPDTPNGRFELYTLHVVLILHRLKGEGRNASLVGQALFDTYLRALDDSLRDLGVGDLSVGKKMRKLGEAFYGRAKAYDKALEAGGGEPLEALITRTLFDGGQAAGAGALTGYVSRAATALAAVPLDRVLEADFTWPALVP
jgi:cytochrome b pre-mRNA-processing protein 3